MGQCTGCIKYLLFIFNFCLWLLGCALLSVGIWIKVDDAASHNVKELTEITDQEYQVSYSATGEGNVTEIIAYLLIIFGIILIVVTFIGCCGAVRENMCFLVAFAVCLSILMIALLAVGSWAFVQRSQVNYEKIMDLRNKTDTILHRAMRTYQTSEQSKKFLDTIQTKYHCCGANDENDYRSLKMPRPASCAHDSYKRGCSYYYFWYAADEIKVFLKHRYTIIGAVSIGVGLCLGLGVFFALLLCCLIRRDTRLVVA